ncbi:MAG TPA: biotin carboxylase N-terminal domain-containing protein, partial [Streptosporangiaceae bacterium]
MTFSALLVANRGEIAVRILRTARQLGIRAVAAYSADDAQSLHVRQGDDAVELPGSGPAAYLDAAALAAAAQQAGCDALHPGYGFLSENAAFARLCAERGITFVGPRPELLALFGDKVAARALARQCGVPVLAGTGGAATLAEAAEFLASLPAGRGVMLKAVAGGGGRGMRAVHRAADLAGAFERCQSEARRAFGSDAVFAEELVGRARHIEVQVIGDQAGGITHLGERECSLQRRHQKLVEITPAPRLAAGLARQLADAAVTMAAAVRYDNVGTFEFLVDDERQAFAFIEANPRLQVEHTVTEEVTGVDLVATQLALAAGDRLAGLGLDQRPGAEPRGLALQVRVNTETIGPDGSVLPAAGTLTAFDLPAGPGIRVDTSGYAGYPTNPRFDSLLAKVIVRAPRPDLGEAIARAARALREFRIEGVDTNVAFLEALLADPDVAAGDLYTGLVADHLEGLLAAAGRRGRRLYFEGPP